MTTAKKVLLSAVLAVFASLSLAAGASAAPGLGVSITHSPTSVGLSDYQYNYTVKVKNVGENKATCVRGEWSSSPTFSYQWLRDGVAIGGATSAEYSPVGADTGHLLQCLVTGTNAGGGSSQAAAPFFYGQAIATLPTPTNPSTSWRPTVTTVETTKRQCNPSANWSAGVTWTYQWLRNGVPIPGATEQKYTPEAPGADENTVLQCLAKATTASGAAVAASNNVNIGSPVSPPINAFSNFEGIVTNPTASGAEWTSGTTTVVVQLPAGITFKSGSGSGWTCAVSVRTCTTLAGAAPGGGELPPLTVVAGIQEDAPGTVIATAIASGGGGGEASAQDVLEFAPRVPFEMIGLQTKAFDEAGAEITQAGSHPFNAFARFEIPVGAPTSEGLVHPSEDIHEVWSDLPVGFVGNPLSRPVVCPMTVFEVSDEDCPAESVAGGVKLRFRALDDIDDFNVETSISFSGGKRSVYRLPPEKGYPAAFGFNVIHVPFVFRVKVRTDGDYGITVIAPVTPQVFFAGPLTAAKFMFCGYGARFAAGAENRFDRCNKQNDPGAGAVPLLSAGTKCAGAPPRTDFAMDSWQHTGAHRSNGHPDTSDPNWKLNHADSPAIDGCEQLTEEWVDGPHNPTLSLQPDDHHADSPAGYTARLHIPQDGLIDPNGLATSHLRNATVTLPEGVSLNPSVGDGIDVCTMAQLGALTSVGEVPPHFDTKLPHCPNGSKIGNARIDTPLLENPLRGSIYLAAQKDNPFKSDYAIYLVVEEPDTGIVVKLAGHVIPDQRTGRVKTVFTENPELPFEELKLDFFGGGRAAIANPSTCGTFTTTTEFTPWSAEDPFNPKASEIARPTDQVQINQGPNGSPCVSSLPQRPFDIGLSAGSKDPIAGAKSPFAIRITRPDGNQELSKLEISPPPGFVAGLKGIPYCSEAQITAAAKNSGKAEEKSPSCPKASEVGTTNSAAGAGKTPLYAPGKLYLSGPYKGQTLSVVAITPAVAGPFDLGNVVIRSALKLDPRTARITAVTDEIPQIVNGIPLRIRDVRINLDRPNWAQNPTNCEALSVDMTAFGSNGATSKPSNRFQVGGCENLGFKPKLEIHLKGGTQRGDHPALLAKLKTREGDANIARVAVTLPSSAFLDQSHIRTICTRVQFAANACPPAAVYGSGKAVTQLLDDPIEGNVYLRSSDNKLPDLVAALKGVANIEAVGRIDSIHGGIRNTFEVIPDAPFEVFTLQMQGGKKGLVVNSQDLCAKAHRATVKLTGQNGRRYNYRPVVIADGCAKGKKAKAKRHQRKHRG